MPMRLSSRSLKLGQRESNHAFAGRPKHCDGGGNIETPALFYVKFGCTGK